jgi:PAS domain-containing protein
VWTPFLLARLNSEWSIGVLNLVGIEFMKTDIDLHQLLTAVGDAVVVCDAAGLITLWNPAAEDRSNGAVA